MAWIQLGDSLDGDNFDLNQDGSIVGLINNNKIEVYQYINNWIKVCQLTINASQISLNNSGNLIAIKSNSDVLIYRYTPEWEQIGSTFNNVNSYVYTGDGMHIGIDKNNNFQGYKLNMSTLQWEIYGDEIKENVFDLSDNGLILVTSKGNKIKTYNYNSSNDTWEQFGNEINGDKFDLSGDGSFLAVKENNLVQVYNYNSSSETWEEYGSGIQETSSEFDINFNGTNLAVESSSTVKIYNYNNNDWEQVGEPIPDTNNFFVLSSNELIIGVRENNLIKIYEFDDISPRMTISSPDVENQGTTTLYNINLNLVSSKETVNFELNDIVILPINSGIITNLQTTDNINYTAIFNSLVEGTTQFTITVPENKYMDTEGNLNIASNDFIFTYTGTFPTINITSTTVNSGDTTNDSNINLTFTLSVESNNFVESDITINGGIISNFTTTDNQIYTAIFTPDIGAQKETYTIQVNQGEFTDTNGNPNQASNQFIWNYDITRPDITITSTTVNSGDNTNNTSIDLIFTLSEESNNFEANDITINSGNITDFIKSTSDNKIYTAIFTPNGEQTYTIQVNQDEFTDIAGNLNNSSNIFEWTYQDGGELSVTITSTTVNNNDITNDESINLIFTLTEESNNFEKTDIDLDGGTIYNFSKSTDEPLIYTATFYPDINKRYRIRIPANSFTNISNTKSNLTSSFFNWTYDSTRPDITITSNTVISGDTTNNNSIDLIFTLSEESNNFDESDITINGGNIIDFIKSDNLIYTAVFTPDIGIEKKEYSIQVNQDVFTDIAGNLNNSSNIFEWNYDISRPELLLISNNINSDNTTNINNITLTIKATKDIIGLIDSDIFITGGLGMINQLIEINKSTYTCIFTPFENRTYTLYIPENKVTDLVGNNNLPSNNLIISYDNTNPFMTITSDNIIDGETTNISEIILLFTSDKNTNNFEIDDIKVAGGKSILKDFVQIACNVYKVTLVPLQSSFFNIYVPSNSYTDNVGNFNKSSNIFSFYYDIIKPNIAITTNSINNINNNTFIDNIIRNINNNTFIDNIIRNIKQSKQTNINNNIIQLIFIIDKDTDNLNSSDINIEGGEYQISQFNKINSKLYLLEVILTNTKNTIYYVSIPENSFTDNVNNPNTKSNVFQINYQPLNNNNNNNNNNNYFIFILCIILSYLIIFKKKIF